MAGFLFSNTSLVLLLSTVSVHINKASNIIQSMTVHIKMVKTFQGNIKIHINKHHIEQKNNRSLKKAITQDSTLQ